MCILCISHLFIYYRFSTLPRMPRSTQYYPANDNITHIQTLSATHIRIRFTLHLFFFHTSFRQRGLCGARVIWLVHCTFCSVATLTQSSVQYNFISRLQRNISNQKCYRRTANKREGSSGKLLRAAVYLKFKKHTKSLQFSVLQLFWRRLINY